MFKFKIKCFLFWLQLRLNFFAFFIFSSNNWFTLLTNLAQVILIYAIFCLLLGNYFSRVNVVMMSSWTVNLHNLNQKFNFAGIFTLTIFFTILAILTGAPIVLFLFCLIPFVLLFKKLFLCHFSDILHHEPLSSIDSFWIGSGHVAHCVLYVDKGLSVQQLRDVISSRLLSKAEFGRFKSRLVYKGSCITF